MIIYSLSDINMPIINQSILYLSGCYCWGEKYRCHSQNFTHFNQMNFKYDNLTKTYIIFLE